MSKLRLCAEIMPSGKQCRQIALKTGPWCHSHSTVRQRQRLAESRNLVAQISEMDLYSVVLAFGNAVQEYRERLLPPLQALAVADAVVTRLEELAILSGLQATATIPNKPNPDRRLHALSTK